MEFYVGLEGVVFKHIFLIIFEILASRSKLFNLGIISLYFLQILLVMFMTVHQLLIQYLQSILCNPMGLGSQSNRVATQLVANGYMQKANGSNELQDHFLVGSFESI